MLNNLLGREKSIDLIRIDLMIKEKPVFTFSIRIYREGGMWGKRSLGSDRYAIDLGYFSFILEFWFVTFRSK